jgi:NAD(P)-dependent dehydrogenase (short-subunit alcohol dehydrogenase family)
VRIHDGRVVLVTGAAGSVGRTVATNFARQGADLIVCDLPVDPATTGSPARPSAALAATARLVREQGGRCLTCAVDVRVQSTLDSAVLAALEAFGHIDVCVAGARATRPNPFAELDESDWLRVIDVSLSGVWRTARAVTPHMVQRRTGVFLSMGMMTWPPAIAARGGLVACLAARHGLSGLMKGLAEELARYDVRANTVLLSAASGWSQDRHARPDAAAAAEVMSWLASDAAARVTGIEMPVDGGPGEAFQRVERER